MANPTPYNPAYQHPKMSAAKWPLPVPTPVSIPSVGPAAFGTAGAQDSPNAAAPATPGYDPRYEDFVARVFPCAGGNSLSASKNVQASQIVGPAEAHYAAAAAQVLTGQPTPLDKK
jgi:hypothetical protein